MAEPFVVCICPTRGRLEYLRKAIACFARQTYQHRELLILADDTEEASAIRSMVEDERVATLCAGERLSIGHKRNILCEQSRPSCVIAHWDDDDWYGPDRLAEQVALIKAGAVMTAYKSMLFADDAKEQAYRYTGDRLNVVGVSLMYRREVWERFRFDNSLSIGEDNDFVLTANAKKVEVKVACFDSIVARLHPGNTSPKLLDTEQWHREPWESVVALGYQPMVARVTA